MSEEGKVSENQLVVFNLENEKYSVKISQVQEIIRLQDITPIPQSPPFVEGVINLRGKIVTVIDLAKKFGLGETAKTKAARIIVVEEASNVVGMMVDEVSQVVRVNDDQIEPASAIAASVGTEYIKGVCKLGEDLVIFLDLSKVLNDSEKEMLAQVV